MNRIEELRIGVRGRNVCVTGHKYGRTAGFIMGLLGVLMLVSCGDDPSPPRPETFNVPKVPAPSSYLDHAIPTESEQLIVEEAVLKNFRPEVIAAVKEGCTDGNLSHPCDCDAARPGSSMGDYIWLVKDGQPVSRPVAAICEVGEGQQVPLKPLSSRPGLRLVRYWKRAAEDCWWVDSCSSRAIEWSHSYGVSQTETEEFGMTIGAEIGVTDPWGIVESTLSAEFSQTVSSSIEVSSVDTVTNSRSIECPCDKRCVFCAWQLVDEYHYVDAAGQLFRDPNYWFLYEWMADIWSTEGFVAPRADEHTQTTMFDR